MPDITTLAIVGAAWAVLIFGVLALCAAAARADRLDDEQLRQAQARRPTVVADTGAIRARLHEALQPLKAAQLVLTVDFDGKEAVLATAPAAVEAEPGKWPDLAVPVRVGGRKVAMLRATRRPGSRRFDAADMFLLQAVSERVASAMSTGHSSTSVPVHEPSAMA